jgi:hypothetical protein
MITVPGVADKGDIIGNAALMEAHKLGESFQAASHYPYNTEGKMNNDLLTNLDKIHTTELGAKRIKEKSELDAANIIEWSKPKIKNADRIIRKGKNWYVHVDDFVLTINAHSFKIITAHKKM